MQSGDSSSDVTRFRKLEHSKLARIASLVTDSYFKWGGVFDIVNENLAFKALANLSDELFPFEGRFCIAFIPSREGVANTVQVMLETAQDALNFESILSRLDTDSLIKTPVTVPALASICVQVDPSKVPSGMNVQNRTKEQLTIYGRMKLAGVSKRWGACPTDIPLQYILTFEDEADAAKVVALNASDYRGLTS